MVGCHFSANNNDLCVISRTDLNGICVVVLVKGIKTQKQKTRTLPAYVVAWKIISLLNFFILWTGMQGKPRWKGCCS